MKAIFKLENHETVVFLTLKELREKAIPRKGVVMQRKNDGEEKKVVVKTPNHSQEETAKHVSMELPTVDVNINNRNYDNRQDRNRSRTRQNRNRNDNRRDNENKNVTVRTFGKKKKDE